MGGNKLLRQYINKYHFHIQTLKKINHLPGGANCRDLSHLPPQELKMTLRRIMASDMESELMSEHDETSRQTVFRTGATEYAVLTTKIYAAATDETDFSPTEDKSYWDKLLANLPAQVQLPYGRTNRRNTFSRETYNLTFPANISRSLERFSGGDRQMLISMLTVAWGLFLTEATEKHDLCCHLLLNADTPAPQSLRLLPIRLRHPSDFSPEQITLDLTKQITASLSHGDPDPLAVPCSHLLGFADFTEKEREYITVPATEKGTVTDKHIWAAQGVPLGVYFHFEDQIPRAVFMYDENSFKPHGIELMAKRFTMKLTEMLVDWKQPTGDVSAPRTADAVLRKPTGNLREEIYRYMEKFSLLQGISPDILHRDIANPRLVSLALGEKIPAEDLVNNCIFVADGMVARNMVAPGGYYNLLDLRGSDSLINETSLLTKHCTKLAAEIMSEEATLIYVSRKEMEQLMNNEPPVMRRLLGIVMAELEKYQKLWVQI